MALHFQATDPVRNKALRRRALLVLLHEIRVPRGGMAVHDAHVELGHRPARAPHDGHGIGGVAHGRGPAGHAGIPGAGERRADLAAYRPYQIPRSAAGPN